MYIWCSLALAAGLVVFTAASFAGAMLAAVGRFPVGGSRIMLGNARCCRGGAMVVVGWSTDRASFSRGVWQFDLVRNSGQNFYPVLDAEERYFAFEWARQARNPYLALVFPTAVPFGLLIAPPVLMLYRDRRRRKRVADRRCERCGYDLRMTPGRCPECGAVPTTGGPAAA